MRRVVVVMPQVEVPVVQVQEVQEVATMPKGPTVQLAVLEVV